MCIRDSMWQRVRHHLSFLDGLSAAEDRWLREACRRQLSGVNLKDEAQVLTLESDAGADMKGNFLLSSSDA